MRVATKGSIHFFKYKTGAYIMIVIKFQIIFLNKYKLLQFCLKIAQKYLLIEETSYKMT